MHAKSVSGNPMAVGSGQREHNRTAIGTRSRLILLVLYLVPTLPVLPMLLQLVPVLRYLLPVHLVVHALPLFVTAMIDARFLDGGEVTPELIPLWSALTGVMLWPLLALSLRPSLWASHGWRWGIGVYGVAAVVATIGAAYWVFTHLGVFF